MLPCEDNECAYYKEEKVRNSWIWKGYCNKTKCYIDESMNKCDSFEFPKTCLDCKHSYSITYDEGIFCIDDIAYYCKLQNNKLIYDDSSPLISHYADIPKCPIDKFEKY